MNENMLELMQIAAGITKLNCIKYFLDENSLKQALCLKRVAHMYTEHTLVCAPKSRLPSCVLANFFFHPADI